MEWKLETRKIIDLKANPKNPRHLKKDQEKQLRASIQKFGACEPLVINPDGFIIGGHQRLRTLKKLGYREVDVYVPEEALNDREIEELTIRLNKNSGDWDFDMLANAWDPEDLCNWGFSQDELHLEEIPGSEGSDEQAPAQSATMNIKFMDAGHLQEAENRISVIVDEYPGSSYKVKVK